MLEKVKLLILSNTLKIGVQRPYFLNSMAKPFYDELENQFEVSSIQDATELSNAVNFISPDLIMIDPGPAIEQSRLPESKLVQSIQCPVILYSTLDAHYHNHARIIKFIKDTNIDAIFSHDFYYEFYPDDLKDKHVFVPNSYNHNSFKKLDFQKQFICGFYGAGFFDQQQYPWRKEIAARVLPEFPSYVLPRPIGMRNHGVMGSDFAEVIGKTQFCFGCTSIKDIPVKKVFEIPACGSMLMTNKSKVLENLGFEDKVNCCFVDRTNVLQTIRYYLDNPDIYEDVVNAGQALVEKRHRQANRKHILNWFSAHKRKQSGQKVVQVSLEGQFECVSEEQSHNTPELAPSNQITDNLRNARTAWRIENYLESEALYSQVVTTYPILEEAIIGYVGSCLMNGNVAPARKALVSYFAMMGRRKSSEPLEQLLMYALILEDNSLLFKELDAFKEKLGMSRSDFFLSNLDREISGIVHHIQPLNFHLTNTGIFSGDLPMHLNRIIDSMKALK